MFYVQLFLDYTAETYSKFMKGEDTFEDEDEVFLSKLSEHWHEYDFNNNQIKKFLFSTLMETLCLDWLKRYLCFHRKTLQCWWSSACFNGREVQNTEWWDGTTGEGEPDGQISWNPWILRVYLLQMEGKEIFCFCPLLRTVWWPKGWIGWKYRQIWSSSRLIGATWIHLKSAWSTKRLSWIMSWRAVVNLSNMFRGNMLDSQLSICYSKKQNLRNSLNEKIKF